MQLNQPVSNFSFIATSNTQGHLADYKGRMVVLYFYPKDATSGCTQESQDFRDAYEQFNALNIQLFGISRDSLKSHEKFKAAQNLPFDLISDPDETLCQLFDVMKMKSMYGKQYMGIERSTFVIDSQGVLIKEWRKVSVTGHVAEVLEFCKNKT